MSDNDSTKIMDELSPEELRKRRKMTVSEQLEKYGVYILDDSMDDLAEYFDRYRKVVKFRKKKKK